MSVSIDVIALNDVAGSPEYTYSLVEDIIRVRCVKDLYGDDILELVTSKDIGFKYAAYTINAGDVIDLYIDDKPYWSGVVTKAERNIDDTITLGANGVEYRVNEYRFTNLDYQAYTGFFDVFIKTAFDGLLDKDGNHVGMNDVLGYDRSKVNTKFIPRLYYITSTISQESARNVFDKICRFYGFYWFIDYYPPFADANTAIRNVFQVIPDGYGVWLLDSFEYYTGTDNYWWQYSDGYGNWSHTVDEDETLDYITASTVTSTLTYTGSTYPDSMKYLLTMMFWGDGAFRFAYDSTNNTYYELRWYQNGYVEGTNTYYFLIYDHTGAFYGGITLQPSLEMWYNVWLTTTSSSINIIIEEAHRLSSRGYKQSLNIDNITVYAGDTVKLRDLGGTNRISIAGWYVWSGYNTQIISEGDCIEYSYGDNYMSTKNRVSIIADTPLLQQDFSSDKFLDPHMWDTTTSSNYVFSDDGLEASGTLSPAKVYSRDSYAFGNVILNLKYGLHWDDVDRVIKVRLGSWMFVYNYDTRYVQLYYWDKTSYYLYDEAKLRTSQDYPAVIDFTVANDEIKVNMKYTFGGKPDIRLRWTVADTVHYVDKLYLEVYKGVSIKSINTVSSEVRNIIAEASDMVSKLGIKDLYLSFRSGSYSELSSLSQKIVDTSSRSDTLKVRILPSQYWRVGSSVVTIFDNQADSWLIDKIDFVYNLEMYIPFYMDIGLSRNPLVIARLSRILDRISGLDNITNINLSNTSTFYGGGGGYIGDDRKPKII